MQCISLKPFARSLSMLPTPKVKARCTFTITHSSQICASILISHKKRWHLPCFLFTSFSWWCSVRYEFSLKKCTRFELEISYTMSQNRCMTTLSPTFVALAAAHYPVWPPVDDGFGCYTCIVSYPLQCDWPPPFCPPTPSFCRKVDERMCRWNRRHKRSTVISEMYASMWDCEEVGCAILSFCFYGARNYVLWWNNCTGRTCTDSKAEFSWIELVTPGNLCRSRAFMHSGGKLKV